MKTSTAHVAADKPTLTDCSVEYLAYTCSGAVGAYQQNFPFQGEREASYDADKQQQRAADDAREEEAGGLSGTPHALKNRQKHEQG